MAENKELETLKKNFAELANNCIAIHQNLGLIFTAGQSSVLMVECMRLSDQNMKILQQRKEEQNG